MATYPFVRSAVDLAAASGPRSAIAWHMAEGGGTVGYLSRQNPNGVSVHFVVEYSGRIVQMLGLARMHTSLRVSAIRTSDDSPYDWNGTPIRYGATAAKAVLREWWKNPNNASIGVEVEGFARDGPNAKQRAGIAALWDDMAARYPGIRSLGHRDFASYKACPGKRYPWDAVGGHGPGTEEPDVPLVDFTLDPNEQAGTITVKPSGATVITIDGGDRPALKAGLTRPAIGPAYLAIRGTLKHYVMFIGTTELGFVSETEVDFAPDGTGDCKAEVAAAITADRAKAKVVWP